MTSSAAVQAFADALSALVDEHEVGDVLGRLVQDCARLYPADAVAVMVADAHGALELLSASSHRSQELELLQIQHSTGPCVDAIHENRLVTATGREDLEARWGEVGTAISEAGYHSVRAIPMHWRGRALGGLNVFLAADTRPADDAETVGQMFADAATLVVVQSTDVPADQVAARIHEAVSARATVEQAKGVLAYRHGVDMATAYELLTKAAEADSTALSETARRVVLQAHSRSSGWPEDPPTSRRARQV
jgi:transcriptional regulator with GAF, ATPase, and Fis domain